LTYYKLC